MVKKLSIKVMSDPGHAWASVPIKLLQELNILDQISRYSYINGKRAYLEEDRDMSILIQTLKQKNIDFELKSSHNDKTPIRNFTSFSPLIAEFATTIATGVEGVIYSPSKKCFSTEAKIIGEEKSKWILEDEYGNVYGVSKNKILDSLKPIEEKNCIHVYNQFGSENIDFKVRVVFEGDKYGLNNCLVHDKREPLVEFYDQKQFKGKGQFVSRYNSSVLIDRPSNGLNLDGGVPSWSINGSNMEKITEWLNVILNQNKKKLKI